MFSCLYFVNITWKQTRIWNTKGPFRWKTYSVVYNLHHCHYTRRCVEINTFHRFLLILGKLRICKSSCKKIISSWDSRRRCHFCKNYANNLILGIHYLQESSRVGNFRKILQDAWKKRVWIQLGITQNSKDCPDWIVWSAQNQEFIRDDQSFFSVGEPIEHKFTISSFQKNYFE